MKKSKYVGNVYDGRWRVTEISYHYAPRSKRCMYTLTNIFNGSYIVLNDRDMARVHSGHYGVSRIIRKRIFKEGKNDARTIVFNRQ